MKVSEADRLWRVLTSVRNFTGHFAYFIEKNVKKLYTTLRGVYADNYKLSPEEQEFENSRNELQMKLQYIAETPEEKEFEMKKIEFLKVLQNPKASAEERDKTNAEMEAYIKEHQATADSLDKRYQDVQKELQTMSEEKKDLVVSISDKNQAIQNMELDVDLYKIPPDKIPDNCSQSFMKEIVDLIDDGE